jgi:hypothetical protein
MQQYSDGRLAGSERVRITGCVSGEAEGVDVHVDIVRVVWSVGLGMRAARL